MQGMYLVGWGGDQEMSLFKFDRESWALNEQQTCVYKWPATGIGLKITYKAPAVERQIVFGMSLVACCDIKSGTCHGCKFNLGVGASVCICPPGCCLV
jgi:hypothetical protein